MNVPNVPSSTGLHQSAQGGDSGAAIMSAGNVVGILNADVS